MYKMIHQALAILALVWIGLSLGSTATAQIAIAPLAGVLDEDTSQVNFRVTNPSARQLDIALGWTDLQALPSGLYRRSSAQERTFASAAPYLQVSPATLRLAPGDSALVTVKRRGKAPFRRGEYRSHLTLTATYAKALMRKASASLPIDMGIAVSIPVIIEHRPKAANVSLSSINLSRNADGLLDLNVEIARQGEATWHGHLQATLPNGAQWQRPLRLFPETSINLRAIPLGVSALPEGDLTLTLIKRGGPDPIAVKTVTIGPPVEGFRGR